MGRAALALLALLGQSMPAPPATPPTLPAAPAPLPRSQVTFQGGVDGAPAGVRATLALGWARFLRTRLAAGADLQTTVGPGGPATHSLLGTLRFFPLRNEGAAGFVMVRAGRALVLGAPDAWALGGAAGLALFPGRHVGAMISYDVLGLVPVGACHAVDGGCVVQGLRLGVLVQF